MNDEYKMPTAYLGEPVIHSFSGTDFKAAATVTKVNARSIDLLIYPDGIPFTKKLAIRHVSDPELKTNPNVAELGCWDFSEFGKMVRMSQPPKIESAVEKILKSK